MTGMIAMSWHHVVLAAHSHTSSNSYDAQTFAWIATFIVGVALGRAWGRRSGVRQVGDVEYRNRWRGIKDEF